MARIGGNLFVIDDAAIDALLEDANAALLRRRNDILDAAPRVPSVLFTPDEIERGQTFLRQIDAVLKEARTARIADGKPFNAAVKRVKNFFDALDTPVKALRERIVSELTAATLRQQAASRLPASAASPTPVAVAASPQGSGAPVAVIVSRDPTEPGNIPQPVIATKWSVAGVDRAALDLEALRPYLTDYALESAARKHLEAHGPHAVSGVVYAQVAKG